MPLDIASGDTARLAAWLRGAPALADIRPLLTDDLAPQPGAAGLFPAGAAVSRRWQDILGRRYERRRARWTLRLTLPYTGGARAENAARLEALAAWAAAQSAAGAAPLFGSAGAADETLTAAGALERAGDEGTAVYAVTLQAEYTARL